MRLHPSFRFDDFGGIGRRGENLRDELVWI
jgi:hypothetical protein